MRLWSNMGYLSEQNPLKGATRGDRGLPPKRGSRFVGALEVRPWVGGPKPNGKSPLQGNPGPDMTYLPINFFMYPLGNHLMQPSQAPQVEPKGGIEGACYQKVVCKRIRRLLNTNRQYSIIFVEIVSQFFVFFHQFCFLFAAIMPSAYWSPWVTCHMGRPMHPLTRSHLKVSVGSFAILALVCST